MKYFRQSGGKPLVNSQWGPLFVPQADHRDLTLDLGQQLDEGRIGARLVDDDQFLHSSRRSWSSIMRR
jgi:hypothetical protein